MRKLDLACGANCAEGYEGVDVAKVNDKVTHVFSLLEFPWPFADESVDEIRCSHYIEHIPHAFYTPGPRYPIGPNLTRVQEGAHSVDLFLKFFDEVFRILKPGGKAVIHCPHGHSDRAFQDPTHERFIMEATWNYLDRDWRKMNGLEHAAYGVSCHFPIVKRHLSGTNTAEQDRELSVMHPATKGQTIGRWWNMISDFVATLEKEPAPVAAPAASFAADGVLVGQNSAEGAVP